MYMRRAEEVKKSLSKIIEEGGKPTARTIAQELDYSVQDVHRCLNYLEKKREIRSYNKEFSNQQYRFVSLFRE